MKLNTIYNEDCLTGMLKIPDDSISMILCDLPYQMTECQWDTLIPFDLLWEQYERITKPDSPILLFGAEPFSTMVRMSNIKDYRYDWYWEKNTATGFTFAKVQPMRSMETISVFYKEKPVYQPQGLVKLNKYLSNNKKSESELYSFVPTEKTYFQEWTNYPNNILKFSKETKNQFHPTQKPVALLEYLIKTYSQPSDPILDNCMGSGATAIACLNTDRQFIGFETNEEYYRKSCIRINENVTQLSIFS